jgi:hypothetical protein
MLIHEVSFNGDIIFAAIREGKPALISRLRSDDFFPIAPCAKIIAEKITSLMNDRSIATCEVFFNDHELLTSFDEEE